MKLKVLLQTMATRAGIAEGDANLKALIDATPDFDVDDDTVANPIKNNLITESEAENKPTIKNKFTAQALNGIDALVDPILGEFFEGADLETFKTENKATTKKIAKLVAKAKELKASSKPSDQAELNKTITELNGTIEKLKTEKEDAVNSIRSEYEERLYFNSQANKIIARTDVTDYAKAKEGKRVIADLKETIEAAGGVLDYKTGKVMQKTDPTQQLFIDHKGVTIESMVEKTLSENEYIKKSDGPTPTTTITTQGGGDDKPKVGSGIMKNITQANDKMKAEG